MFLLSVVRSVYIISEIVNLCRCFLFFQRRELREILRQGTNTSERKKEMLSLFLKESIKLRDSIRCVNNLSRYKYGKSISSTASNNVRTRIMSSSVFNSFGSSRESKEIEHIVDGISFTIHNNTNIYKDETSNIPIVLIHGCYGSKKNFRFFNKYLKSNKIITIDLRNHGNSIHTDTMKYEEMENDIKNVLEKLQIKKCCLVGFSLGGKVSMYCALKNSSLFSHLIVMDILPFDYNTKSTHVKLPYNISYMTEILFNIKTKMKPRTKAQFLDQLREKIPNISNSFAQFICMSLVEVTEEVRKETNFLEDPNMEPLKKNSSNDNQPIENKKLLWKINVDTIYKELPHILSFPLNCDKYKYTNPCNFIIGQKSDLVYTIPDYESIIKNFFPTCHNFVLPNASHTVYIDNVKECAGIVNNMLRL
ncbi:alpha/beta hydrolase [Plasmodium gonderi]|uniref:Alpha/beta hydrolase n=1 Tax=Plasmodium gonderi TaxID=77519 RepID=A0A1Y1JK79_PLAGO|nr:alpha/beta hydrolase [Plasmodium gonderi]GAW81192.1 alpha/beta hydrolase [Plasmodium gonderi]